MLVGDRSHRPGVEPGSLPRWLRRRESNPLTPAYEASELELAFTVARHRAISHGLVVRYLERVCGFKPLHGNTRTRIFVGRLTSGERRDRSRSSVIPRLGGLHAVPGQMLPCQPVREAHAHKFRCRFAPRRSSTFLQRQAPKRWWLLPFGNLLPPLSCGGKRPTNGSLDF
jgi:hypothetical protein